MTSIADRESRAARLAVVILFLQYLGMAGEFLIRDQPPYFEPDSQGYVDFAEAGIFRVESLRSHRTLGYPCVLRVAQSISPDFRYLPLVQTLLACGASWMWFKGLRTIGVPVVFACVAASSILLSEAFGPYERRVALSDLSGTAWVVIAVSCLLLTIPDRSSKLSWMGLALTVAAAYHTRPAKLYLVVLIPLLGVGLRRIPGIRERTMQPLLPQLFKWVACSWGPLVGYCLIRLAVVGHFGLVSFGGINVIGLAGQLLRSDDLARLSLPSRDLATEILKRREIGWVDEDETARSFRSPQLGRLSINRQIMDEQYNAVIWKVAVPAAYESASDLHEINRMLTGLSSEVLRLHIPEYANWITKAYVAAWTDVLKCGRRQFALTYAVLGLVVLYYFRSRIFGRQGSAGPSNLGASLTAAVEVPVFTALAVFGTAISLVVLVEPPIERYLRHEAVFIFSAMSCLAAWLLVRLCAVRETAQTV